MHSRIFTLLLMTERGLENEVSIQNEGGVLMSAKRFVFAW